MFSEYDFTPGVCVTWMEQSHQPKFSWQSPAQGQDLICVTESVWAQTSVLCLFEQHSPFLQAL